MKQVAQRPQAAAPRMRRKGSARSARQDAHERQAERAARGFVQGAQDLARFLTPTPPAGFQLPASHGEPLPSPLRVELERAFQSDLSTLRIHRDATAAAAVQRHRAVAFAASSRLYFGAGQFDPLTPPGRRLIAHEVAHALQQGATRTFGAGWRLEPRLGSGPVQMACLNPPPETSDQDLFDLYETHFERSAEGREASETIDRVRTLLGGRLRNGTPSSRPAFGQALADAAAAGEFDGSGTSDRGFVVDCLKIMGFYEEARAMLEADERLVIRIGVRCPEFEAFLGGDPATLDWAGPALERHWSFREYWTEAIIEPLRRFLLRPHTPPEGPVQRLTDAANWWEREYLRAMGAGELIPQERVLLGWRLLPRMDRERVAETRRTYERSASHAEERPTGAWIAMLRSMRGFNRRLMDAPETPAHRRALAEALVDLIDEVMPQWETALGQWRLALAEMATLSDAELIQGARLGGAPVSGPLFDEIHAALTPAALELFSDTTGESLLQDADAGPARYEALLQDLRARLMDSTETGPSRMQRLDEQVSEAFAPTPPAGRRPRRRQRPEPDLDQVRARMALGVALDDIIALTYGYDLAADAQTPHFADERGAHRVRMARALARLAHWTGWTDLLAATRPTLTGEAETETGGDEPPSRRVQLWLDSDWTVEPVSPVSRMIEDFPENLDRPVIGRAPLTVRHLVTWFQLDYNRRLARALERILAAEDRPHAGTRLPGVTGLHRRQGELEGIMGTAEEEWTAQQARETPQGFGLTLPHRFRVQNWTVTIPPDEAPYWPDVIETHPKTQLQLGRHRDDPVYSTILYPMRISQGVFAWVLPSIRPLIRYLRGFASVRRYSSQGEETRDDMLWLEGLNPDFLSAADWDDLNTRIRRLIERPLARVREEVSALRRRVSSLQRRILVMQLRGRLDAFIAQPALTGRAFEETEESVRRFRTPVEAAEEFFRYERVVRPRDDETAQMGLLMLQLAPQIESMAGLPRQAGTFNQQIYPWIAATLEALANADSLGRMRQCAAHPNDQAGNIIMIPGNLSSARERLQRARTLLDTQVREVQAELGYRGNPDTGDTGAGTITPLSRATPIHASEQPSVEHTWRLGQVAAAGGGLDISSGTPYRLARVHRAFRFHPSVGTPPRPGLGASPYVGARVLDESGDPIAPDQLLFSIQIGDRPHPVTAGDLSLLEELNDIFLWRSFSIGMQSAAEITEAAMQWLITVAAIAQPELAYAELATSMIAMASSREFEEIVAQFLDDPESLIQDLVVNLGEEVFRPERVWRFLLLGGGNPLGRISRLRPQRTPARSLPSRTALGRVLLALRTLGERFAYAIDQARLRTRGPLRSAQASVSMRPRLVWLLMRASEALVLVSDALSPGQLEALLGGATEPRQGDEAGTAGEEGGDEGGDEGTLRVLMTSFAAGADEAAADMETALRNLLEGIARFDLPAELVDLQPATELIVGFIVDRFGPRARAYRLVMQVVPIPSTDTRFGGATTLYTWLTSHITELWRASGLNPNHLWQERVIPLVGARFRNTRDALVDDLYEAVNRVLPALGRPAWPRPSGLPETEVRPEPLDPAAQPFAARSVHPSEDWHLDPGDGVPMDPDLRSDLERGFAMDFSHVRLHQGDQARTATLPIGADAVTSGSHVYLRPGIPPSTRATRRLLAHELAHVVQQTGAAPPGAPPRAPTRGFPGLGLRVDAHEENLADRAAERVAAGGTLSPNERRRLGRSRGIQPSLGEALTQDLLRLLATSGEVAEFLLPPGGVPVPGEERARTIWNSVDRLVRDAPASSFAGFLREDAVRQAIKDLIRQHVTAREGTRSIGDQIPAVANLAQRPVARRRRGEPGTELDVPRFANLLEGYLAARTGVALEISLNAARTDADGVRIHNIDLSRVPIGHALWDRAMRPFSDSDWAIRRELYQRLGVSGISQALGPGMWESGRLAFGAAVRDDYRSLRQARTPGRGGADIRDVPNAGAYRNVLATDNQGLAVSTHGDLRQRNIGARRRESHHMSQYLLAQFFSNRHGSFKPFPRSLGSDLPGGIEWRSAVGGTVDAIRAGGARRLRIYDLSPSDSGASRGDAMPAILIASRTHKRGRLHIQGEGVWNQETDELNGRPSQARAMLNTFNRNLPPDLRTLPANAAQATRVRAWQADHPNQASRRYYDAAVASYHWMYMRMMPALERALPGEELAYYRGIAAIQHSRATQGEGAGELEAAYDLRADHMAEVFRRAKAYHDRTMRDFGWPTP